MHKSKHPRSSKVESTEPRFLNPSPNERNWIGRIPDSYPDILRAPAVSYKADRDDARIKANQYVSFARPYRGKQGLLIIGKQHRPILIDETQPDKPQVLPMRLDREAILDTWIFSISLYTAEGLIQIEDCIVCNGEQIRSTKTFKERYAHLQSFIDSIWFQDKQFQLNWQVSLSQVHSLEHIRMAMTKLSGGNICLMPNLANFRLLKVNPQAVDTAPITTGPKEFLCFPVEGKPDVYDLKTPTNLDAGRASIQTLSISQALQHKCATSSTKNVRVLAEWNEDFESYVVLSLL